MIARSLAHAYVLETVVGKSEMQSMKRMGTRTNPCWTWTPFLRRRNLLSLPLAVVRAKVRLPTSSMIKRTVRLSGSNRTNLQVQVALTAVTDVIKETSWFISSSIVSSQ